MGRPKDSSRREKIIAEYQRCVAIHGFARWALITKAVGLHSNNVTYAQRIVKEWKDTQVAPAKGMIRKCLCCESKFMSEGKNNRLCKACAEVSDDVPFEVIGWPSCAG